MTLRARIADLLKERRRLIIETIVVIGLLIIAVITATGLSPYRQPYEIRDKGDASLTLNKAQVLRIDGANTRVRLLDGPNKGTEYTVDIALANANRQIKVGGTIVVSRGNDGLPIPLDAFRIPALVFVAALFIGTVVLVGRRKGVGSLIGLGVGVMVIAWLIVPTILRGGDALAACIGGAYLIAVPSILIAHGIRVRTLIAAGCVCVLLGIASLFSVLAVSLLALTGSVDETAASLTISNPAINLQAIVTGGLVIASLGVLDDIVTGQVATVDELLRANRRIKRRDLYRGAFSVGAEHVASLVNTLVLLYAGAALPTLVTFALGTNDFFLLFNSEYVVTEILHALIPGTVLVLAVPVSTVAAVRLLPVIERRLAKSRHPLSRYLLREEP